VRKARSRPEIPGRGGGTGGSRGFTYFTVLILVAIIGAGLAAIGTVWHHVAQREKEAELLFIGGEFRRAIGGYFEGSPGGPQYPKSFDDLLLDKRFPVPKHHLRKVYVDPMTASRDWGLVKDPAGLIQGVYSKATGKPLKTAKFKEEDKAFSMALTYADWKFLYGQGTAGGVPAAPGSPFPISGPSAAATADPARAVPLAPPTDTASARDDPARETRRPACQTQREKDIAACEAMGPASMQNPAAVGCATTAAQRFNVCMDGPPTAPATAE
jgi:type II secretory pathway pseudopilin PulG